MTAAAVPLPAPAEPHRAHVEDLISAFPSPGTVALLAFRPGASQPHRRTFPSRAAAMWAVARMRQEPSLTALAYTLDGARVVRLETSAARVQMITEHNGTWTLGDAVDLHDGMGF